MEITHGFLGSNKRPYGNTISFSIGDESRKHNNVPAHYSGLEVSTVSQGLQVAVSDLPQRAVGREEKQALPYCDYKDLPNPPPEPKHPFWRGKRFRIILAIISIVIVVIAITVPVIKIIERQKDSK